MSVEENKLNPPQNLRAEPIDGGVQSKWSAVSGADGYILSYYLAENPSFCIKTRYAQNCSKIILGFKNGVKYYVTVKAFRYVNGREVIGEESERVVFVPISSVLKAQNTICLAPGESEQIICEYQNTIPSVKYRSTDREVATVDSEGFVTAVSEGYAVINVSMDSGERTAVRIRVSRNLERNENKDAVIMLAGDIMCSLVHQRKAVARSFDFSCSFDLVKPLLEKADFSVGVLETVCCDNMPFEHEKKRTDSGSPNCNSPSSFISAVKHGGFNALVTANNHNCDCSGEGLITTVEAIKKSGLYNIGTLGDNPVIIEIKGIKVAFIGCNIISNGLENGCFDIGNARVNADIIGKYSTESFEEFVREAKRQSAEYIIAYQHFGKMNSAQIRSAQMKIAQEMADLGADFIVGSHPHVMHRFDNITAADGRCVPCAYSLGNFLTSMNEMTENTESALLRLQLNRKTDGSINCSYSYIPIKSIDISDRVVAKPLISGLTNSEITTQNRIENQLGYAIGRYKEKVLVQGSIVLRKIFENFDVVDSDLSALLLSPVSIMSGIKDEYKADSNDLPRVKLDIEKQFADYLMQSDAGYIIIDFYTAASVSHYKFENNYYTATLGFCNSAFFKKHKDDMELVKQPLDEALWRPYFREYAKLLLKKFPKERIILLRLNFSDKCAKKNQLRNGPSRASLNRRIKAMEQYFIEFVNPIVIDISGYYFADGKENTPSAFEPVFYENTKKTIEEIIYGGSRRYYYDMPDYSVWIDRVVKYYNNMTDRAYYSWLLDNKSAADIIMRYSSPEFISQNKEKLILLKKSKSTSLADVRKMFDGDYTAQELIAAADAIALLLAGDTSEPYSRYSIIFDKHFEAVKLLAKQLTKELNYGVCEKNAQTVFLLLSSNLQKLSEYINAHRQIKVDIWGSCITRESVNRNTEYISVGKYIFKQPPVLLLENNIDCNIPGADKFCGNEWRRRTVKEAFEHEGMSILDNSSSDWLLVDFYDLICRMVSFKGGLFEIDDFIQRTDFYKSISSECTPAYLFNVRTMSQCESGMKEFAAFVSKRYGKKIILIKIDLKDRYITLDNKIDMLDDNDDSFADKKIFLSQMENMFISLTDCFVVDVAGKFYADDSFPLGGAHIVHYESEFYSCCCRHITEILSGSDVKIHKAVNEDYLLRRDMLLNNN